jgi:hypothetical protein
VTLRTLSLEWDSTILSTWSPISLLLMLQYVLRPSHYSSSSSYSYSSTQSESSFDQNYFFFLDEVEIFNLTTPELDLLNEAISAYQNMSNYANYVGYSGQPEPAPLWNTSMSAGEYVRYYISSLNCYSCSKLFPLYLPHPLLYPCPSETISTTLTPTTPLGCSLLLV